MRNKIVLVLDCGATNIRTVAVNEAGEIVAQSSCRNYTQADPFYDGGFIWDTDEIWGKFIRTIREIISRINMHELVGMTITTFGADGAPMKENGELVYPVISWECQRTVPVMEHISNYIPLDRLYKITRVNAFSFNTINKFVWFKENRPEVLEAMDYFVLMPSIFIHKLTGKFITDVTMAGTTMMTDISTRGFSEEILHAIGIENKFPRMVESGTIVGKVSSQAAHETGIPEGLPVIAGGHDTQFAIFGSGAGENEAVLSSGTWEILMARSPKIRISKEFRENGGTVEFDVIPGLYNPGLQWLGSGILEWIRNTFYAHETGPDIYEIMIREAESIPGSTVRVNIDFLNEKGILAGLGLNTKREEIYRVALEALARKTRQSLDILEQTGNFNATSLTVVGGGSKNTLWNRLREKELGIPVKTIDRKETTVFGAAKIAFKGLNISSIK